PGERVERVQRDVAEHWNDYSPRGWSSPIRGPGEGGFQGERGPFGAQVLWDPITASVASADVSPASRGTIAVTGRPSPSTRRIRSRRSHLDVLLGSVEM